MRPMQCLVSLLLLCFITHSAHAAYKPTHQPGPRKVETLLADWVDATRDNRTVPVKIYYPAGDDACPVVIFSHGLGGSRTGYEMHGQFWASHGYISVHLQHAGSDDAVWRGLPPRDIMPAMRKATMDPAVIANRPKDVTFAIDTLEKLQKDAQSPFHKRLDLARLGMAGHSFGSWTTLAVGGLAGPLGQTGHDKRIKAMIPMSSPAVKNPAQRAAAYGKINIPALHMTGTLDDSPIGDTSAQDRRIPFDHSPGSKQGGADCYLITLEGGDHAIFSGASARAGRILDRIRGKAADKDSDKDADKTADRSATKNEIFHQLIHQTSLAFLDAYLRENKDAKKWLQSEQGMKATLADHAKLEMK